MAAIELNVRVNSGVTAPNELAIVEMTIANSGTSPEVGLDITLPYPSGVNSISEGLVLGLTSGSSCATVGASNVCDPGDTMVWSLAGLNPGEAREFSFPVRVSSGTADGTDIDWAVEVDDGNGVVASETATLSVSDNAVAALSVDQDLNPVAAGGTLSYTLNYGNPTSGNITNAGLAVTLPAGTTFVSATGGGTLNGNEVSWSFGTLTGGAVSRQTITVDVDSAASAGTLLPVTAEFNGTANFLPTTRRVGDAAYVGSPGTLALTLAANPSPALPNEIVVVSMNLANTTNLPVLNAQVLMRYPEGVNSIGETFMLGAFDSGASCAAVGASNVCDANDYLVWNIAALNPGQAIEFSFPARVTSSTPSGSLANFKARLRDGDSHESFEKTTLAVDSNAIASVSIDQDKHPVAPGDVLTYTLRYGNTDTGNITNAALALSLPAGTTFLSATGGGTLNGDEVAWALGTMTGGAVAEQTVRVQVGAGVGLGTLLPVAAQLDGTANFLPTVQRHDDTAYVGTPGTLALSLQVNPLPAQPNEFVIVSLTLANTTNLPVFNGQVTMRYPDGMSSIGEGFMLGAFDNSASCASAGASNVCDTNDRLIFSVAALDPGKAIEASFPARVAASTAAGTQVPWQARIVDGDGAESWESTTLPVDGNAVADVSIEQDKNPAAPGDELTYTLHYGNTGTGNITNTDLRMTLPSGTTFLSASGGGSLNGDVISWSLGTLTGGAADRQVIRVGVDAGTASGTLLPVSARLDGTANFLPTTRDASDTAYVGVAGSLDLTVDVNPLPAQPNELVLVTLNLSNSTNLPVLNPQVTMRYPEGMNSISEGFMLGGFSSGSSCASAGASNVCDPFDFMVWNATALTPGQTREFSFPARVASGTPSGHMIEWQARVIDGDGTESWETTTLPVFSNAVAAVAIDQDKNPVEAGDVLTYAVRFGNPSTGDIDNASLSLTLPDGTTFLTATGGGSHSGGTVTWALGTLTGGAIGQRAVRVEVDGAAVAGTLLPVAAELDGTANFLPSVRRASDTAYVGSSGTLALTLNVNALPALPGEQVDVAMTLTNTTGLPVLGSQVVLRYPVGMSSISEGAILGGFSAGSSCASAGASNVCDTNDLLIWNIAQIDPGQSLDLSLPPNVANGTSFGSLIDWSVRVVDADDVEQWEDVTLPVGSNPDTDGDGIGDAFDNCIVHANPNQRDSNEDGFGNRCDADFNNDNIVNVLDLGIMRLVFFSDDPDVDIDGDGIVNVQDLGLLRTLFFLPPGPSALVP